VSIRSIALAFGCVAPVLLMVAAGAPAAPERTARIALLPIAVHAAGSDVDYLQSGLAEMVAARLDQYEGIVVLRPAADAAPPADEAAALEAARALSAQFVLWGSFTRFGDGASLDLRCASVGEPVAGGEEDEAARDAARRLFVQSGTLAQIIPQLDTLANKVARHALAGGGEPRIAGAEAPAEPVAAPAGQNEFDDIARRLDALERAVFHPVASGSSTAPSPEADASVVR
jgi:TolB-like protein